MPLAGRHGESMEAAVSQGIIRARHDAVTKKGAGGIRPRRETCDRIHEQIKYRFKISVLGEANLPFVDPAQCQDALAVAWVGQMSATLLT